MIDCGEKQSRSWVSREELFAEEPTKTNEPTSAMKSDRQPPRSAQGDLLTVCIEEVYGQSPNLRHNIRVPWYPTLSEFSETVARVLTERDPSRLHMVHNGVKLGAGIERDDVMNLQPNDVVVVHRRPANHHSSVSFGSSIFDSVSSTLKTPVHSRIPVDADEVHTEDDREVEFQRQMTRAMEASKMLHSRGCAAGTETGTSPNALPVNNTPLPEGRTFRENLGNLNCPQPIRTQYKTERIHQSTIQEYGEVVCRGSVSQYSVTGGTSACTSFCLVVAHKLLLTTDNRVEDTITPAVLDSLITHGVESHGGQQHTCLDDLWPSSPYAISLERGLPIQNMTSKKNFLKALNECWEYTVGQGQVRVAVILTKAPETILCFGVAEEADGQPQWYLFDSHGEADATHKVAYVVHFSTTGLLADALATKYPLMHLEAEEHYTMQMLCQFEVTPIIVDNLSTIPKEGSESISDVIPVTSIEETKSQHSHELTCLPDGNVESALQNKDPCSSSAGMGYCSTVPGCWENAEESIQRESGESGDYLTAFQQEADVCSTRSQTDPDVGALVEMVPIKSVKLIREQPMQENDLMIAVPLCKELYKLNPSYALDGSTGKWRCMVTCCVNVMQPERSKHCHHCGRVVCRACRNFFVSSIADHHALSPVCLECATYLVDAIAIPSLVQTEIRSKLQKFVIGKREEQLYNHAKWLLRVQEQAKAATKYEGALNVLTNRVAELNQEREAIIGAFLCSTDNGDVDMVPCDASGEGPPDPPQRGEVHQSMKQCAYRESGKSCRRLEDTYEDWKEAFKRARRSSVTPLPFGLAFPVPSMSKYCSSVLNDLEEWARSQQSVFEAEYVGERERLQEQRASLIEEIAILRRVLVQASARAPAHDEELSFTRSFEKCPQCHRMDTILMEAGTLICRACGWTHENMVSTFSERGHHI